MVIHNQKLSKIILALRRGLIKVNLLYDHDLFLNNHLSGFRPRRSGVPFSKNYIKLSRLVRFVGIATSVTLVLLTLAATFPIVNHQNDAEATYVPAITTLSIVSSKDTASVDIIPTSASGTFATSAAADMAEFTVTTDNLTGYSLNILGTDTSGQLVNTSTGDTIDTISADVDETTFSTGAASTYNNKWGYRLTVNSTTTTDFFSAPTSTSTAKTIYTTSAPNTTGTSDSFTLGVGARVDYTKPVGTYTNTFVLTAVANNISYQINYLDADGTTQLLTPDAESNISASSIELNSTAPTKSGYNFLGWCDGTLSADGESCTGTTYQPGDIYTFTSFTSGTTTANLYAMWENAVPTMQTFTIAQATAMAVGDTENLEDERDGQIYTVKKLADGNIWMTRNLAIGCDGTGSTYGSGRKSSLTLTTSDSNVSTDFSISAINSLTLGDSLTDARMECDATYGAYYNYAATAANTINTAVNTENASYDVCPAGWRLPTYAEQVGIYNYPSQFGAVLGGMYLNGSHQYTTNSANYQSSTRYNDTVQYSLWYNGSALAQGSTTAGRNYGWYIRCVKDSGLEMQNITYADLNQYIPNAGDSIMLKDNRDGQRYAVAKLADGNIWMADNLNLGATTLNTDLTQYNTNLTTTVSATTFNGWKKNTGTSTNAAQFIPVSGIDTTSKTEYGTLYSLCAVSASTVCDYTGANIASDICPAGWRLPTGGASGEFQALANISSYNTKAKMNTSIANGGAGFALPGYFMTNPTALGTAGFYWSRTDSGRYALRMDSTFDPAYRHGFDYVNYGFSMRCILNDSNTLSSISTMQEVTPQVVAKASNGDTATLTDTRDGQEYTVAKINGNLWMTRNLAIGCDGSGSTYGSNISSRTLLPSGSNIASAWSTPTNSLTLGDDYTDSRMECSSTYGAWYNYAAASAGTITGPSNTSAQVYDICPAGWRLPNNTEATTISSSTAYRTAFNFIDGGVWSNGSTVNTDWGYWWLSIAQGGTDRYILYNINTGTQLTTTYLPRNTGRYVRCIAKQL